MRDRPSRCTPSADPEEASLQIDEDAFTEPVQSLQSASLPSLVHLPFARRLSAFGFLLLAEFFYGWAWNTVDVLRPLLRQALGLSLTQAGSAYSAQGAGALIGAVTIGQLADRLGRRNMLVLVMVGYGALLIAGVLVHTYPQLLTQRFALGLFLGGSFPVVVALYVDLFRADLRGKLASAINTTFSLAIVLLGWSFGHLGQHGWQLLLWVGGVPPILLAGFAYIIVPQAIRSPKRKGAKIPVTELFSHALRRQTLLLACLTGLNFFAYQAFSGWLTTYLQTVRRLPTLDVGHLVSAQFLGNIAGGFFWGWAADRFGRRFGAIGFFVAAAAIGGYLFLPNSLLLLYTLGALFGFALSSSVVWGPWLDELYPPHLKSTASSIFNWGRLLSFFAPLITGALAARVGLRASMLVSSIVFTVAAAIWLRLPETLVILKSPRPTILTSGAEANAPGAY